MKQISGIYKITSPSNRIYIGQSVDIQSRFLFYKRVKCEKQRLLYFSFKKYGVNKHKFEILCQCDAEELNNLEKYYVDLFQSFNSKYGMNLKDGGGAKVKLSDETKKKISESNKGFKHSHIFCQNQRMRMVGNKINKGYKPTLESFIKRRETLKANPYIVSQETKMKKSGFNAYQGKLVINLLNGIFYGTIRDAAKSMNIPSQTLSWMLNKKTSNNTPFIFA